MCGGAGSNGRAVMDLDPQMAGDIIFTILEASGCGRPVDGVLSARTLGLCEPIPGGWRLITSAQLGADPDATVAHVLMRHHPALTRDILRSTSELSASAQLTQAMIDMAIDMERYDEVVDMGGDARCTAQALQWHARAMLRDAPDDGRGGVRHALACLSMLDPRGGDTAAMAGLLPTEFVAMLHSRRGARSFVCPRGWNQDPVKCMLALTRMACILETNPPMDAVVCTGVDGAGDDNALSLATQRATLNGANLLCEWALLFVMPFVLRDELAIVDGDEGNPHECIQKPHQAWLQRVKRNVASVAKADVVVAIALRAPPRFGHGGWQRLLRCGLPFANTDDDVARFVLDLVQACVVNHDDRLDVHTGGTIVAQALVAILRCHDFATPDVLSTRVALDGVRRLFQQAPLYGYGLQIAEAVHVAAASLRRRRHSGTEVPSAYQCAWIREQLLAHAYSNGNFVREVLISLRTDIGTSSASRARSEIGNHAEQFRAHVDRYARIVRSIDSALNGLQCGALIDTGLARKHKRCVSTMMGILSKIR